MSGNNTFSPFVNLSKYLLGFLVLSGGLLLSSCDQESSGFALPEGDIEIGKVTFQRLACNDCHSIADIAWKESIDSLNISLGGDVYSKKTYGELVTSVINPSHKIAWRPNQETATADGKSKMRNYNEIMTVQDLIDIVAFLQSEYQVMTPPQTYYRPYIY